MNLVESIETIVREAVEKAGRPDLFRAPLCGFSAADDPRYHALKTIIGEWHRDPAELLPEARSVISFFVPFTQTLPAAAREAEPVSPLWGEAYVVLNNLFDAVGKELAGFLTGQGYAALPIASTHTYDPEKLQSMWSHRSAAAISGLGSFGANRLLITEKGSAGRFCTVLTSAQIAPSPSPAPERCLHHINGSCLLCVKSCPVHALKPDSFEPFVCNGRLLENADRLSAIGFCDVCGKCIANCPAAFLGG